MKKILFLSFAAFLSVSAIHAQTADTTAKAHKEWKHKGKKNDDSEFYKKLNLTDDQKSQLKTINQDQKTKVAAIKSNTSLSEDQKKAQVKAAKKEAYDKRQAIYTPAQKAMIKEDHDKKHKHNKKGDTATAATE